MTVQMATAPASDHVATTLESVYGQGCNNVEDMETESQKMFDFTEKSIRRSFIRKVYSLLMCQILVTVAVATFFMFCRPVNDWLDRDSRNKKLTLILATVGYLMVLVILLLFKQARRRTPMNYIFLGLFTVAVSIVVGIVTTCVESDKVLIALGVTALVFLGLTLFAFQTKWDITIYGAGLLVMLLVLTIYGLAALYLPEYRTLRFVYSGIGVVLFSFYIIYDTQLMMGGDHKYSTTPEEYVFAVLNLYMDMMNLFLDILRLMR